MSDDHILRNQDTEVTWSTRGMYNSSHTVDDGLADDLKAGMRAIHAAWDFNGQVWYDPDEKIFKEDVYVHHVKQATLSASTPEDLMRAVNDEYGWA